MSNLTLIVIVIVTVIFFLYLYFLQHNLLRTTSVSQSLLLAVIIRVLGLIMHDQAIVHKIKAIRTRLPRRLHHFSLNFRVQFRQLVDVLDRVFAVRDEGRSEVEVERFDQLVFEMGRGLPPTRESRV